MTSNALQRRAVVADLLRGRTDALLVSGLGAPTYDVAAAGDHERNFYLWGAMGGAAMIGLGLALAQPRTPVIVLTGDGEMLMGLGSFATIAALSPRNLAIVVLDNGLYGETGAQPTHTSGAADLAAIAHGCGIAETMTLRTEAEVAALAPRLHRLGNGPLLAVVKIAAGEAQRVLPTRDGAYNAARLRKALQLRVE